MTQEEIIEMARQAGFLYGVMGASNTRFVTAIGNTFTVELEAFAKLVAEKEREKSLKLWMLLDDIDTADDIAKSDDDIYRSLCRQLHKKRWDVLNGDEIDKAIKVREIA